MGKQFKLRWSLIFPSFQSCKSKDPSTLPESPVPINPNFIKLDLPPPTILPFSPADPHHHPKPDDQYVAYAADDEDSRSPEDFRWKKEEKWHIVSRVQAAQKVSEDSEEDPSPSHTVMAKKKQQRNNKKKNKSKQRIRISTSSPDSEWFSSDNVDESKLDDEGTETIVSSSRTLSTDSSSIDIHDQLETISERPIRGSRRRRTKNLTRRLRRVKCVAPKIGTDGNGAPARSPATETLSPARLSMFGWLMPCAVEGKVRESFAVVKKSVDPFEDFKRSMVEMILEKQMVEARDLEQLLQCFLSLNSRDHHGIIVQAFAEIYEAMFSQSPVKKLAF